MKILFLITFESVRITLVDDDKPINDCVVDGNNVGLYPSGVEIVQAFLKYMEKEQKLLIGRPTAERFIRQWKNTGVYPEQAGVHKVKGRDLTTGFPATRNITDDQIRGAIMPTITQILKQGAFRIMSLMRKHELPQAIQILLLGDWSTLSGLKDTLASLDLWKDYEITEVNIITG